MLTGVIVNLAVGLLLIVLGLLLWKKQTISMLHSYHYQNVKKEDIPEYTKQMGIGQIIMGAGICITGVFNYFMLKLWYVPLVAGIVIGILIFNRAQRKYNGSWFS